MNTIGTVIDATFAVNAVGAGHRAYVPPSVGSPIVIPLNTMFALSTRHSLLPSAALLCVALKSTCPGPTNPYSLITTLARSGAPLPYCPTVIGLGWKLVWKFCPIIVAVGFGPHTKQSLLLLNEDLVVCPHALTRK